MKREALDHPKLWALAEALEQEGVPAMCSLLTATGLLERLWAFAAKHTPDGRVGKYSDSQISHFLGWTGDRRALAGRLTATGWLDESEDGLIIHDWADHADRQVHRVLARRREWFADGTPPNVAYCDKQERESIGDFYTVSTRATAGRPPGVQRAPAGVEPVPVPVPVPVPKHVAPSGAPVCDSPPPEESKPPPDSEPEDLITAEHLARAVSLRLPGSKIPPSRVKSWARHIAKIDSPPEEVRRVIDWLHGPNLETQCPVEVRSGEALKRKWQDGTIEAAVQRWRSPNKPTGDEIQASALRILEEQDVEYERRVAAGLIAAK